MSDAQRTDPNPVVMTGENSFIRLSNDGGKTLVDRVSHWRVLWSPAGQGHALFIDSPLLGAGPRVYADNAAVARYLQRNVETLLHAPFGDESLPVREAEFSRGGNALSTVEERIGTHDGEIVMSWWDLMPAFVMKIPPGEMNRPIGVYTTFLPARSAQLAVDGEAATAKVFQADRFGRGCTSCVLAWSETWVGPIR